MRKIAEGTDEKAWPLFVVETEHGEYVANDLTTAMELWRKSDDETPVVAVREEDNHV